MFTNTKQTEEQDADVCVSSRLENLHDINISCWAVSFLCLVLFLHRILYLQLCVFLFIFFLNVFPPF